jgi:3-keto-disaccharide hydrolase
MGRTLSVGIAGLVLFLGALPGHGADAPATTFRLDSVDGLDVVGGKAEVATYRGRKAVRLVPVPNHEGSDDSMVAILKAPSFKDGTIEAEIAGFPRPGTSPDERGFVGIAFRVQPHGSRYECFYLRPTNGRADDQLRRNHSTQYVSEPDYPWFRLRKENPGVYESYVDLEGGAWTRIKIVVVGTQARLYVNGADQPALIVNDLKLGETSGQVALWAHWSTDAYFSNLTIK